MADDRSGDDALVMARINEIEKFVSGRMTAEEEVALRLSTTPVEWFGWLQRKQARERAVKVDRERDAVEALIAECTGPIRDDQGSVILQIRTNRLLGEILRKLWEPRP